MIANERRIVSILSVGSSSLPGGIARVESMLTRTRKPSSSRKTSFVRASSTIILCISAVIYIQKRSRQRARPAMMRPVRAGVAHLELGVNTVEFDTFDLLESVAHIVNSCIEFKVFWRFLDNLRPRHSRRYRRRKACSEWCKKTPEH